MSFCPTKELTALPQIPRMDLRGLDKGALHPQLMEVWGVL